jgi:hypothetical protein
MEDVIRMVIPIKGDGRFQPPEQRRGGNDLNNIHLLLSDAALMSGFEGLGAPEDHEALLGLRELGVLPMSIISLSLLTFWVGF